MNNDLTTWTAGFTAGHRRGLEDIATEAAGRPGRDPEHRGHPGEPPTDLTPDQREQWIDGFLDGYADGRCQGVRGEAA